MSSGQSPFDEMANALADVQRRKLLVALLEHNPPDDTPIVIDDSDSETVTAEHLVEMHHVHLPKLAEYGFISWDQESHEVEKGRNFEKIRPLLVLLDNNRDKLPSGWV